MALTAQEASVTLEEEHGIAAEVILPMPSSKPLEQIAFPHAPQIVDAVRALF